MPGIYAFNDKVSAEWFAPAGFARGSMNAQSVSVRLNEDNLDDLVAFLGALSEDAFLNDPKLGDPDDE